MKEKLTRLAKGIPDDEAPALILRPEQLSCTVPRGGKTALTLEAESENGASVRGFLFCDDPAINIEPASFGGRKAHISVTVRPGMIPSGSVLEGCVTVLTMGGERRIPYRFTVEEDASGDILPEEVFEEPSLEDAPCEDVPPEGEDAPGEAVTPREIPEDEAALSELAAELIRRQDTGDFAFRVYSEAVRKDLPLNRLYECYAAAFPFGVGEPMQKPVVLYFSYDRNPEQVIRDRLYANVLKYYSDDSVYSSFEPLIRDHAYASVQEGRINEELALIYDRMFRPESLDRRTARALPSLLFSCLLTAGKPASKVEIRISLLKEAEEVLLRDGSAFAAVLPGEVSLLALDRYGNRLPDVSISVKRLWDRPDLLSRSYELCPDHPLLCLLHAEQLSREGIRNAEELALAAEMIRNPALSDSFREDLLTAACAFGTDISWFNRLPSWIRRTETFDALFHAYLRAGETGQAYLLLRNAGLFTGDKEALGSLTETLIGEDRIPYDQGRRDRFFTCLALYLFDRDAAGPKTLSYLAAVYEGPQEHMRALLTRLTETGTAPGDLPERLLVSMLFSGADSGLDELFLTYIHTCAYKDLIVRAFFTRRLAGYFLYENASPAPDIFAALYSYIHTSGDPESLPRLYLIALTKHYSERDRLMEEEQELCQKLTDILIRENLVFAYTKKLKKKISLPPEILDRYYIEYHGTGASAPRLLCRIGSEQEPFREIPLLRVFESVYTAKLLLFLGDELHYMIYDGPEDDRPVQEGMLRVKKLHASGNDRSSCINRMVRSLDAGDFKQLEEDMLDYALRDEMRKELYTIEE